MVTECVYSAEISSVGLGWFEKMTKREVPRSGCGTRQIVSCRGGAETGMYKAERRYIRVEGGPRVTDGVMGVERRVSVGGGDGGQEDRGRQLQAGRSSSERSRRLPKTKHASYSQAPALRDAENM